ISSYHLLTLVLAFGVIVLIFGETIITAPFAACFLYQKDQHALVESESILHAVAVIFPVNLICPSIA
ncbi:hypothetical protein, partial [Xenorhabdus sp. Sc-CR9]|uniref:hypothetical protein n=1 Tax=Xenorhabdus sp. Sc-CR9 TaxID=2584468 RepID=UPI001F31369D